MPPQGHRCALLVLPVPTDFQRACKPFTRRRQVAALECNLPQHPITGAFGPLVLDDSCDGQRLLEVLARLLASFDQALAIKPAFAEVLNSRGAARTDLKRYTEALASCRRRYARRSRFVGSSSGRSCQTES